MVRKGVRPSGDLRVRYRSLEEWGFVKLGCGQGV